MVHARFDTRTGADVLVEQRTEDLGYEVSVSRGSDESIRSSLDFNEAINRVIEPVADSFFSVIGALSASQPDELVVQFGVRLHYRDGAVVSDNPDGSHFKVTVKWSTAARP